MADQTYNLTQTGAEVQAIINDANNVKGAGATTSLTTDYVMLKDTSGQYHKIQKDSFTEAVRNTLASLLVNNDKGTTISQIAAIASGDFGSVTPANLASVLGAWLFGGMATSLSQNADVFGLGIGSYTAASAVSGTLVNRPSTMSTSHTCRIYVLQQTNTNNYKTIIIVSNYRIFITYLYTSSGTLKSDGWRELNGTNIPNS